MGKGLLRLPHSLLHIDRIHLLLVIITITEHCKTLMIVKVVVIEISHLHPPHLHHNE